MYVNGRSKWRERGGGVDGCIGRVRTGVDGRTVCVCQCHQEPIHNVAFGGRVLRARPFRLPQNAHTSRRRRDWTRRLHCAPTVACWPDETKGQDDPINLPDASRNACKVRKGARPRVLSRTHSRVRLSTRLTSLGSWSGPIKHTQVFVFTQNTHYSQSHTCGPAIILAL